MNASGHDDERLDDVAVYALGAMPKAEAGRVRAHMETCAICRDEFQALQLPLYATGLSAPEREPSRLLKSRIMRVVRGGSAPVRQALWPPYLVAAACFAIALISTLVNLSLIGQLKTAQNQVAQEHQSATGLARSLAAERTTVADLTASDSQRYPVAGGEVVRAGDRLYITMHDIPAPPRGKVYQAWTLAKGSKLMEPSVTFVPDRHGSAIIALPVDAALTAAVAVSVEPDGGSKQPTSKPTFVVTLG